MSVLIMEFSRLQSCSQEVSQPYFQSLGLVLEAQNLSLGLGLEGQSLVLENLSFHCESEAFKMNEMLSSYSRD